MSFYKEATGSGGAGGEGKAAIADVFTSARSPYDYMRLFTPNWTQEWRLIGEERQLGNQAAGELETTLGTVDVEPVPAFLFEAAGNGHAIGLEDRGTPADAMQASILVPATGAAAEGVRLTARDEDIPGVAGTPDSVVLGGITLSYPGDTGLTFSVQRQHPSNVTPTSIQLGSGGAFIISCPATTTWQQLVTQVQALLDAGITGIPSAQSWAVALTAGTTPGDTVTNQSGTALAGYVAGTPGVTADPGMLGPLANGWQIVARQAAAEVPGTPAVTATNSTATLGQLTISQLGAQSNGVVFQITTKSTGVNEAGIAADGTYLFDLLDTTTWDEADLYISARVQLSTHAMYLGTPTAMVTVAAGQGSNAVTASGPATMSGGRDAAAEVPAIPAESPALTVDAAARTHTLVYGGTQTLAQVVALFDSDAYLTAEAVGTTTPLVAGTYALAGGATQVWAPPVAVTTPFADIVVWCEGYEQIDGLRLRFKASHPAHNAGMLGDPGAEGNDWTLVSFAAVTFDIASLVTWVRSTQRVVLRSIALTEAQLTELAKWFDVERIGDPIGKTLVTNDFSSEWSFEHGRDHVGALLWFNDSDSLTDIETAFDNHANYTAIVDTSQVGTSTLRALLDESYTPPVAAAARALDLRLTLGSAYAGATYNGRAFSVDASAAYPSASYSIGATGDVTLFVPSTWTNGQVANHFTNLFSVPDTAYGYLNGATVTAITNASSPVASGSGTFSGGVDAIGAAGDPALRFSGGVNTEPLEAIFSGSTARIRYRTDRDNLGAIADVMPGHVSTWFQGAAGRSSVPEAPATMNRAVGAVTLAGSGGMGGTATPLSNANPLADGTAAPGSGGAASREDHVHPSSGGGGDGTVTTAAPVSGTGASGSPVTIADAAITAAKLASGVLPDTQKIGNVTSDTTLVNARSGSSPFTVVSVVTAFTVVNATVRDVEGNGLTSLVVGDLLMWDPGDSAWERVSQAGTGGSSTSLSDANPQADGTAAPGTGTAASREDHVHPDNGIALSDDTPQAPGTAAAGDGTSASRHNHVHARQVVANADIANVAVTSTKIASGAVTNVTIASQAVTSSKLGAQAVTSAKIATGAVNAAKIADGVVGTDHLSATGTKDATTFLRGDNTWAPLLERAGLSEGAGEAKTRFVLNWERNNPSDGTIMSLGNGNSGRYTGASVATAKIVAVYLNVYYDSNDTATGTTHIRLWKNDSQDVDGLLCEGRIDFSDAANGGPTASQFAGKLTLYSGTLSSYTAELGSATEITEGIDIADGDIIICEFEDSDNGSGGLGAPTGAMVSVYIEETINVPYGVVDGRGQVLPAPVASDDTKIVIVDGGLEIVRRENHHDTTDPTVGRWAQYTSSDNAKYLGEMADDPGTDSTVGDFYYNIPHHKFRVGYAGTVAGSTVTLFRDMVESDTAYPTGYIGYFYSRSDATHHAESRGVATGEDFIAFTGTHIEKATNFSTGTTTTTTRRRVRVPDVEHMPFNYAEFWGHGQTERNPATLTTRTRAGTQSTAAESYRLQFAQATPNVIVGADVGIRALTASEASDADLMAGETAISDFMAIRFPAGRHFIALKSEFILEADTSLGLYVYKVQSGTDDFRLVETPAYGRGATAPLGTGITLRGGAAYIQPELFTFLEPTILTAIITGLSTSSGRSDDQDSNFAMWAWTVESF